MARSDVSVAALKERCGALEGHVKHRKLASGDELASYRPGGPLNRYPPSLSGATGRAASLWNWVWYHAQLVRFCGREDTTTGEVQDADAIIMDALRGAPEVVEVPSPLPEAPPQVFAVYPKSMDALIVCHTRDRLLLWLATRIKVLRSHETPETLSIIERGLLEISYQHGLMCWIVTHRDAGLPFTLDDVRPELPPEIAAMDTFTKLRISRAHMKVNGERLAALEALVSEQVTSSGAPSKRPSWSVFIGTLSQKMGVQPQVLMRDYSLGEMLAAVKLGTPELPADVLADAASGG